MCKRIQRTYSNRMTSGFFRCRITQTRTLTSHKFTEIWRFEWFSLFLFFPHSLAVCVRATRSILHITNSGDQIISRVTTLVKANENEYSGKKECCCVFVCMHVDTIFFLLFFKCWPSFLSLTRFVRSHWFV